MEQMEQAAKPRVTAKSTPRCTDVMIDLETLGTQADAVIVSIGAVKFTPDGYIDDAAFYAVCEIGSQPERHISGDTLGWWMNQSDEARRVFNDPNKIPLRVALEHLYAWVNDDSLLLWSNGADFDIPIIEHAARIHQFPPLVRFFNHRCYRTLKDIFKEVPKPPFEGTQHNALMDAIHQARHVQAIHKFRQQGVIDRPPATGGWAGKPAIVGG